MVDPFIPASLLVTRETQVGAVRGPEPSQASPQKSAFFLLEVTCYPLPESERPNATCEAPLPSTHQVPLFTKPQNKEPVWIWRMEMKLTSIHSISIY